AAGMGRFRISYTQKPGAVARDIAPEIESLLTIPAERRTPEQLALLRKQFLAVAPELAGPRGQIQELRNQLPTFPTTLVMQERPPENPRPTFRHHRGEFLQPKEQIQPGVISILPGLPADAPRNRLSFARWIASPTNPLVGRVTMNRQWAALFGRGIVRTTEDFGYQGESPSNQELLDYLAVELVRRGWSMKDMHRLIVTSATYRQSSKVTSELLQRDPNNELLARGPRSRLEAELVRDSLLHVSGLLSSKIGGPSVFPPQPANVTTEGAYGQLAWRVSEGADRYRRGVYTFAKRTAPYAMFTTFDGPSGEACVARREMSNTPLQALTLLNDQVFLEAAQALGRKLRSDYEPGFTAKLLNEDGTESMPRMTHDRGQLVYLFRMCMTRPPTARELEMLVDFRAKQYRRFVNDKLDAKMLAGSSDGDVIDKAVMTALARALLNLDEAISKH
ncbi:MAG TPA: DUF1553 domain-containing protein, partial [Pirellulaceae bacterium]|nr:DUF1553 domain-containing protein [Pirellulaceae bacterium]